MRQGKGARERRDKALFKVKNNPAVFFIHKFVTFD